MEEANAVTEVTRREIFDSLRVAGTEIYGRLPEIEFLDRVFNLAELPSHDPRFDSMKGDIQQHTIRNFDWPSDWIYSDARLNLWRCPDQVFLKFIAEMVHPVVRPDLAEAKSLVDLFNENLRPDGWELVEAKQISGRPVFSARPLDQNLASSQKKSAAQEPAPR